MSHKNHEVITRIMLPFKELRHSMYMSYGRYDICMVRCDAQRWNM